MELSLQPGTRFENLRIYNTKTHMQAHRPYLAKV